LLVTAVAPSAVDLTWASLQAAMVSNWQVEASYFAEQSDHTHASNLICPLPKSRNHQVSKRLGAQPFLMGPQKTKSLRVDHQYLGRCWVGRGLQASRVTEGRHQGCMRCIRDPSVAGNFFGLHIDKPRKFIANLRITIHIQRDLMPARRRRRKHWRMKPAHETARKAMRTVLGTALGGPRPGHERISFPRSRTREGVRTGSFYTNYDPGLLVLRDDRRSPLLN